MLISDLPIYDAPNYAPLKPLLDLKERDEPVNTAVADQCIELLKEYNSRDEASIFAIAETAYTISSFIQGKQIWQKNYRSGGGWELAANRTTDPNKIQSVNIMQFQASQMLEDIISSNPDFEPADMFLSYEYEKQVKASKAAWNEYERKFYTSWFNIQQALGLITGGTVIEQVKYDATAKAFKMFREIWGEVEVPLSDGFARCYECPFEGRYEDFHQWQSNDDRKEFEAAENEGATQSTDALKAMPQCPECGSFEVDGEPAQTASVPSVVGLEQFDIGDFVLNNVPIQSTRFDVSKRFEDSRYGIIHQYVPTRKIKHLFGDFELEAGCESDRGLDYLQKMARIGASIGGARRELSVGNEAGGNTLLTTFSASAEDLAEIKVGRMQDDGATVSGGTLDKDTTLADVCPDGGTLIFLNKKILYGIYPRHHSNECSSAVYFAKPGSGTGRGAEDLTEIQKRKNRLDAQQVAAVDGASPGYAYVEGSVDEKHIKKMGFPNAKIPVRREFFNMTKNVEHFVRQFDPQQVAPQLFAYSQEIDKLAQMTAHCVTLGNAVFDASGDTATEANILAATAQAITIPFLQSKAGMREGTCRNLRRQYKEIFGGIKRKFSMKSGNSRHHGSIDIDGADVSDEIPFGVIANSFIPQNFYSRKVDYSVFTNMLGGIEGVKTLKDSDPHLFKTYTKAFNVDFGDDGYDQIQEICRMRMNQAHQLAAMFENEMAQQAQMPPQMPPPSAMPTNPPMTQNATNPPIAGQNDTNSLTPAANNNNLPSNGQAVSENQSAPAPPVPPEQILYDLLFEQITPRIRPTEKTLLQQADWFAEFLNSAEALKMTEEQRGIIAEFVIRLEDVERQGRAAKGALENQAAFQSGLPVMAAQKKLELMSGQVEGQPTK